MTFTLPESLASDLQTLIPNRHRSRLITKLLQEEMVRRKELLVKACQAASSDPQTNSVVDEWQGFDEKIQGPTW